MELAQKYQTIWKKIGIIGGVYLGMKYLVPLMVPFLVAALAAYWARPLFWRMEKWFRIKPAFSAGVVLIAVTGLAGFLFYLLGNQLWGLASRFLGKQETSAYLEQVLANCCQSAERILGFPAEEIQDIITAQMQIFVSDLEGSWMPKVMSGSVAVLKAIGKAAAASLVTAISFVLWSGDFEKIKEESSGSVIWRQLIRVGKGILEAVGGYVKAQCIIIALVMTVCSVGFWFAKSPYALLLGICTGLLDALPVVGTGIVILPWLLTQILGGNYGIAAVLAVTYGICTLVREVLEPRLVGRSLGLFPILVLMSVYVGVRIYGIGGILLGPLSLLVIQELWREMVDKPSH